MRPLDNKTRDPDYTIRPYRPTDRDRIRLICCQTGFLGEPIDEVFGDLDLFADYLTRYYTDIEPESIWVGEKGGEVVSYLLTCKDGERCRKWNRWNALRMGVKALFRLLTFQYDAKTLRFMKWAMMSGKDQTPPVPAESAHFHFNSLKEHRKMGIARDLLVTMMEDLKQKGIPRVYGQMTTYDNRRTEKVFEYIGWKVVNRVRVTKYEGKIDKPIYTTTIMKEFSGLTS